MTPTRRRTEHPPRDAPPPLEGFRQVDLSVDLHGMRVRSAIPAMDRHIRLCHSAGMHVAHIIHGRGTGALRDAIHQALDSHPLVARHYPASYGQGGDGVTIVELDHGRGRPVRRRRDDTAPAPIPTRRGSNANDTLRAPPQRT